MAGVNKVILVGHLGRDPEIRVSKAGMNICNFSLAVSEKSKDGDTTEWFKIIAFDKLADICGKYLTKGKQVYIEGKIKTSEWTDKDGNKKQSWEVIANNLQMLGSSGQSENKQETKSKSTNTVPDDVGW
jgi:single-strand DNA-binding protein